MKPERRCAQRKRPTQLSYVQLDLDSGGIVLNASESGLAFQVVGAVRGPGPIRVCISPNPKGRIELPGEIVWLDEAKRFGGLRFTELAADARDPIRRWLTAACESETPQEAVGMPVGAVNETSAILSDSRNVNPDLPLHSEAERDVAPGRAGAATILAARHDGFLPPALSLEPVLQPVERIFVSRVKLLRGIATGVLICVFVPILLLQDFRSEIGNSLIRFGEKLKGNSETQLAPIMSMPIQSSTPSSGSTPSVPKSNLEIHSQETLSQPNPAASDQTPQGASSSTDLGLEDRQYSSKHLADVHSERGRSLLTQRLWSAIGSGDISAEVALAQLYLTGDGVPKNCDQARVLLKAASRNGNIEALQELRKLSRSGCR